MKRYYQPSRIVIAGVNVDHQHLVDLTNDHFVNKPPMWHREGEAMESPDRSIAQYTGGIVKVFWNTPGCFVKSFSVYGHATALSSGGQIKHSRFKLCLGTSWYVLGLDTLLQKCQSSPMCTLINK